MGAGMAGVQTAVALREQGWTGEITLLGAESHPPYDRPPLSKTILLGKAEGSAFEVDFAGLGIEVQLGREVTALRAAEHRVDTVRGSVSYDVLVIATGAVPVRLPGSEGVPGCICCAPWTTPSGCGRCWPPGAVWWRWARAGSAPSSPPRPGRRAAR